MRAEREREREILILCFRSDKNMASPGRSPEKTDVS